MKRPKAKAVTLDLKRIRRIIASWKRDDLTRVVKSESRSK